MATQKKRRSWLPFIIIGLFLLLLGVAAIALGKKPKGEEVTAEPIQRRTINETVSGSGKIFPETEVKISSDVSGEIIELYVKEGDSVTMGQVLAKIRPDEYQSAVEQGQASVGTARSQKEISTANIQTAKAQIDQMRADRNRAAAQLETAKNAFARSEKLFKEGVVSTADFEAAQNSLRAAEAGLAVSDATLRSAETSLANAQENVRVADFGINSANARMKELRTSLQKTIITAPVSGIISKLSVEKGERVVGTLQMAGTEMMRIANLRSMEVQVDVSENDILKVGLNDEADIEVDAYLGKKFKGKVTEIANSASNVGGATLNTDQVTNFIVKIRVDPASYADMVRPGQNSPFRPGMSASVDIYTQKAEGVLAVPLIAVTTRESKADAEKKDDEPEEGGPTAKKTSLTGQNKVQEIVFMVVGDTVAVREVSTGIQDNDFIEIKSGLNEGEQVVTGPYSAVSRKLESGKKVRVVQKDALLKEKKSGNK